MSCRWMKHSFQISRGVRRGPVNPGSSIESLRSPGFPGTYLMNPGFTPKCVIFHFAAPAPIHPDKKSGP